MRTFSRSLNNDGAFASISDITINGIEAGRGAGNIATNTAFGDTALDSNTTGSSNSAFGINALTANLTGNNNTAIGSGALAALSAASGNTAIGINALAAVNNNNNTATGGNALANSTGGSNVANGFNALTASTSGNNNVAVGTSALASNTTSTGSTAIGTSALGSSTGANNSACGNNAGFNLTTGSNDAFLGNDAQPSAVGVSNEITLGNASIATLRCQVTTITALSDARDKKDIADVPIGLDFINALRPVKFTWSRRDGTKEGVQEAGFIAQELDAVQQEFGAEDYLQLVYKSNPEKLEATPGNLLPIMVKAIQELKAEFDAYKADHP